MAEIKIKEGKAPFKIASIDESCFTYYKIIGDLSSGLPPVVVAHGGPGAGHEYLLTFADLWRNYGLPVVFYDQIGCASSTHLQHKAGDRSFWQEQLFQDELDNLIDHLELRRDPGFHFLGQSWGGMLGAAFAARQPQGLRRLVLASALANKELATRGTKLLREQMPPDMRQALEEAEKKAEYEGPAYKEALDFYFRKHVCRAESYPPVDLLPALKNLSEDTTVYRTMNGPSPLTADGTLDKWTVISRLPKINVPTLVYNGEFDTSHDIAQVPFFELIPRVRWITFPNGGHMCHLEEGLRERILKVVGEFLTQKEVVDV
ncbi:proline-specific peptidase [Hypoxylon trugodes]|uniref:proline-specific peptidase n=1 Tax=Hypoxylon trugodes TaxID=326681 RepID=UPI002192971D|nr:proline-specific peptidase [Hypoxylon trugodes]KAI1389572.1 proline-specific peptidase [Hypoxylon trugodes]